MSHHECAISWCTEWVDNPVLMCDPHWAEVPYERRVAVADSYQPGQAEGRVLPTAEYISAVTRAVGSVTRPRPRRRSGDEPGERIEA